MLQLQVEGSRDDGRWKKKSRAWLSGCGFVVDGREENMLGDVTGAGA